MKRVVPVSAIILLLLSISNAVCVRAQDSSTPDANLTSATDLRVPAGAISLALQRKLVPGRTPGGLLGARWRMNWDGRLARAVRRVQIDDWAGTVSFTQVGQRLEFASASGERISFGPEGKALLTKKDGGTETFDAAGRLIERTFHHGNKVVLRYTPAGRVSRVEGPGGGFLQFTYDGAGRIVRVTGSTGAEVRYTYAGGGDLAEVAVNGGTPVRYAYDSKGAIAKFEDPQTGALDISRDAQGRAARYHRADGSEQRFEYDDATNTKRIVEPNGATTVTSEDTVKRRTEITDPLGHKEVIQFDEASRSTTITDPTGATTRVSYDASGRMTASVDALGRTTRYEYAGDSATVKAIVHADGTRQEFEYNPQSDLTAIKIGTAPVATLSYNPDGSIASAKEPGAKERKFTYYPNGLVKSAANALGETVQFEYDARGNLVRETNPLGGVTVRSYDPQDRLVSQTDPAGATTRYEYDARGLLAREIDPAGGATTFEYDARGRLIAETNPAGQATRYDYTPTDKLAKVSMPGGQTESYSYDLAGNLTTHTDSLGRTTTFEYDAAGRVTHERWPTGLEVRYRYDAAGTLLAVEDNGGAKSEYQTDASGRTASRTNPDGGKVQYKYDALGNLKTSTDPLGHVKQFEHTDDGDLLQAVESSRDEARYERDAVGRILSARRPSGGVSRFTYDRMGNLLTDTDPLGGVKRYNYDNAGRLLGATDAVGRVTRYVYDNAGRRVEKQLPDGKRVAYKYDALGRMIVADDGAFPVNINYDEAGRLKRVEYAGIKKSVAYEYDAQGLRTKLIAPDGREVRYEYDQLKRLSAVVLPDGKRITLGYDEKNRTRSVAYPNGITGRLDYDAAGRTANISYQDKRGKPLAVSSYRYDLAGNVVERQDGKGKSIRFGYDDASQLVEETNDTGSTKYRYAAGGNRAAVEEGASVRLYRNDAADRLIEAGKDQLSYDANGSLVSRKGTGSAAAYEYDAEGRLTKVVGTDGTTTTFGYAPTGERAWRRSKSGATYFLYDGINLLAELGEDLRIKTFFVHGFAIDRPLAMLQEKQSYYYLSDRLGSITHLTDDKGKVIASYTYDAFGKLKAKQGTIANPFAYAGRELDPTGLYYYRERYYDADLGRFLANDPAPAPLDEPLEQNPYLYVGNNPATFVDPLGLSGFSPEYLNGQNDSGIIDLFKAVRGDSTAEEQIYRVMRSRGMGMPQQVVGQPSQMGATNPNPAQTVGMRIPQQIVGRPGQLGAADPYPDETVEMPAPRNNQTGAVNGGSPNRAGANTVAVRPQPGPPGSNTQQVGEARPGGDTLRVPIGSKPDGGFWTLNPNSIRPSISGAGTVAGLIATAADCYRNGLSNCGPKIVQGIAIGGIATAVIGKAAGPIGTLIAGGKAWWEIDKELNKGSKDQQQRDEQTKAREAQARANLNNRDTFYPRIEQLRAKINALQKDHDTIVQNMPRAEQRANDAAEAEYGAKVSLQAAQQDREQRAKGTQSDFCRYIEQTKPAAIKNEIEALAKQAENAQAEIDRLSNEARQKAAHCSSAGEANEIKAAYSRIKALTQQIAQLKASADHKHESLEKIRYLSNNYRKHLPGDVVSVDEELSKAEAAAKEATDLVTRARDAKARLDASEKPLRREIFALQAAVPEAALSQMQDKFNELNALLSAVTTYPPVERFDDKALQSVKQIRVYNEQLRAIVLASSDAQACDPTVPSADAAIQRINTALSMAAVNDNADLLHQAQACEVSGNCLPAINQARELLERLEIEAGEAAINQVRQNGCNVEGLMNALEHYRTIRDAAALLFNAKEQCKFEEGLAFAQKMPASTQNSPWLANGIAELRAGLAAQQKIDYHITRARASADIGSSWSQRRNYEESRRHFEMADAHVAQAESIAAPYPCLSEKVHRYQSEYGRLKQAVNEKSGGQGATDSDETASDDPTNRRSNTSGTGALGSPVNKPKVEEIPSDADEAGRIVSNVNKGAKQPKVEEIPDDAGGASAASSKPARGRNNPPPKVEEIPDNSDAATSAGRRTQSGTNKQSPAVEEIPEETAANNRPPSDDNSRSSTDAGSATSQPAKKQKKPRDPNKPSIWTQLGGALRQAATAQSTNSGGDAGGGGASGTGNAQFSLTGNWKCEDGAGTFVLTQSGSSLTWEGQSSDGGATWTHTFTGEIVGDEIRGSYQDHPPGVVRQNGKVNFKIISNDQFQRTYSSVGGGGCSVVVRQ
jgi:RHS repeat-associated protein